MEELKHCPFCGGRVEVVDDYNYGYAVRCRHCNLAFGVHGRFGEPYEWIGLYDSKEEAIEAWNTRVSHACYADEVTHRNCKYSVHRGWCEHGCKPIGEWRKTSQTQEVRERVCGCCGEEFGMDRRNGFPIPLESLCELPNYCPNCGTKVVKE